MSKQVTSRMANLIEFMAMKTIFKAVKPLILITTILLLVTTMNKAQISEGSL